MKNKIVTISIVLYCFQYFSCNQVKKVDKVKDSLEVFLEEENDTSSNKVFDYRYTNFLLFPLKERYPEYYRDLLKKFKNVPTSDSLFIVSMTFQKEKFLYDLYEGGYFQNEEDKKKILSSLKDSAEISKLDYNYLLNVLSIFENGQHKIIVDSDNDYDFGNNHTFVYNKNLHFDNNKNPDINITDTLPIIDVNYQVSYNRKIIDLKRKVNLFPYPNYFYTQLYRDENMKKHALLAVLKDYWKGHFLIEDESYTIFVQGLNEGFLNYVIKHDSLLDYSSNGAFDANFRYDMGDTLLLSNNYLYKIDSISLKHQKLFLNKIKGINDIIGHRMGFKLQNYKFQNLEKKDFSINDFANKKYVLLDFWGTWCVPCKKLIPNLKKMNSEYSDKLNIIGISYRDSLEALKDFTSSEEMNWAHTNFDKNVGILKDLKILFFPTYVLLNKDRWIIYIGSGEDGLKNVEMIIKNND